MAPNSRPLLPDVSSFLAYRTSCDGQFRIRLYVYMHPLYNQIMSYKFLKILNTLKTYKAVS